MSRRDTEAMEALERARSVRAAEGDAAAIEWFRRAVERPRWDDFDPHDGGDEFRDSWRDAALGLALCSHSTGDVATCAAWMLTLAEDAAAEGGGDRATIREEAHKPWRIDYQCAAGCESIRHSAIVHLLDEHDLAPTTQDELAGLLTENRRLRRPAGAGERDEDVARIRRVLGLRDRVVGAAGFLTDGFGASAGADRPLTDDDAWRFVEWVLAVAVPEVFRVLGVPGDDELAQLLPTELRSAAVERSSWPDLFAEEPQDIEVVLPRSPREVLHPYLSARAWKQVGGFLEWENQGGGPNESVAYRVLDDAGLLRWISPFSDRARSVFDPPRLFAGTPVWSALWLATLTDDDAGSWVEFSDFAGSVLFSAIRAGLDRVAEGSELAVRADLVRALEAARDGLVAALTTG